jgi:hypothetical protein
LDSNLEKDFAIQRHTNLTFKFQGRNFRLTDVAGKVVSTVLA